MSFSYSVFVSKDNDNLFLQVGVAYYGDDGKIDGFTLNEKVTGNSIKELEEILSKMNEAIDKPFLWIDGDHIRGEFDIVKDLPPLSKFQALVEWQNAGFLPPLKCNTDSDHPILEPKINEGGEVWLECYECGYKQTHLPIICLKTFFYNITSNMKQELLNTGFKLP